MAYRSGLAPLIFDGALGPEIIYLMEGVMDNDKLVYDACWECSGVVDEDGVCTGCGLDMGEVLEDFDEWFLDIHPDFDDVPI